MYGLTIELGNNVYVDCHTRDVYGAMADADSAPPYAVYEDDGTAALASGSMAKRGIAGNTGCYVAGFAATTGAGFEVGKTYHVIVSISMDGVATVKEAVLVFAVTGLTAALSAHDGKIDTAQSDLNLLTGSDGATLATSQPNYAPNTVVPDAAGVAPTVAEITADVDSNSTQLQAIVADTNELQADDVPGLIAALDTVVDGVAAGVLAEAVDGDEVTLSVAVKKILAVCAHKLNVTVSGSDRELRFRDAADSADVVSVKVLEDDTGRTVL